MALIENGSIELKKWKSFNDQIELLKSRGMVITDIDKASVMLERFGYYRLSGYWRPLRKQNEKGGIEEDFIANTSLSEVVDLYVFDKRLRIHILDALERIEISLQVDIAYLFGRRDPIAHLNPALFNKKFTEKGRYSKWLARYRSFEKRSGKSAFVKLHKKKYGELPIWVAVQILDFGALSHLFAMLPIDIQSKISQKYNLKDGKILISILRSFSQIRNACAHHERVWNNVINDHAHVPNDMVEIAQTDQYLIFRYLCLMQYLLMQFCPQSQWGARMKEHLLDFPNFSNQGVTISAMGVPKGWDQWDLWK